MIIMVSLFNNLFFLIFFVILGKWDQVTGVNSPLYRSHTELENHEAWKNAVKKFFFFFWK
jgi:hypothetical protein